MKKGTRGVHLAMTMHPGYQNRAAIRLAMRRSHADSKRPALAVRSENRRHRKARKGKKRG